MGPCPLPPSMVHKPAMVPCPFLRGNEGFQMESESPHCLQFSPHPQAMGQRGPSPRSPSELMGSAGWQDSDSWLCGIPVSSSQVPSPHPSAGPHSLLFVIFALCTKTTHGFRGAPVREGILGSEGLLLLGVLGKSGGDGEASPSLDPVG